MKRVLIKPLWPDGLGGRLFETCYPWSFQKWREAALAEGIELRGWDTAPLETADCVWFLDLCETRREYDQARKRARPGVPFVLQVMETPVGRSENFHHANQALFDYIVTYQHQLSSGGNLFTYRLPHGFGGYNGAEKPFAGRKCVVMVNSNRIEGWLAKRRPGLVGLPGVGKRLSGWHQFWWTWLMPAKGELYSWRRRFARMAEVNAQNSLEVYGPGWNGDRISWNPFYDRSPYRCCVSNGTNKKLDIISEYKFTISVENFRGSYSYISEKFFDPLIAGSVPVYLGDERIQEVVPTEAFVDVRRFRNQSDLLAYLINCPQREWEKMRCAGQEFLKTPEAKAFSTEAFVANMISILKKILNQGAI